MKKYMVLAVFAMIAIMALGMLNTGAWFTDHEVDDLASIQTGILSFDNDQVVVTLLEVDNIAPGWVSDDIVFRVINDGNINLGWFGDLQFSGSPKLMKALYIDYAKTEFINWTHDEFPTGANYDEWIVDGVAPVYNYYNNLAAGSEFGVLSLDVFNVNAGMGAVPYEFNGAIKPGMGYMNTIRLAMVEEAGNDYQDLGPLTIKLVIDAKQLNADALGSLANTLPWMEKQIGFQP